MTQPRLQKHLSHLGIASRRTIEQLIREGRIEVNGRRAVLGDTVPESNAEIRIDGKRVMGSAPARRVWAYHKPKGVICSDRDPEGRTTVFDLLGALRTIRPLYLVGRLDYATDGIILLTTDGELKEYLLRPKHHVPKVYRGIARGIIPEWGVKKIRSGIFLAPGERCQPAEITILNVDRTHATPKTHFELTLTEGKYHQVRRMLKMVGTPVERLTRIRFGPVSLKGLPVGHVKELSRSAVDQLTKQN